MSEDVLNKEADAAADVVVDVVIVGAGAAGLMCALTAGARGRSVLVLDHANKVGKKILMSGGGRCNFTNMYCSSDDFLSGNSHFCKSALSRFTQWDFIAMVEKHSIPYHEKTLGQLFCDNKARDIVDMLLAECQQAGVKIHTRCSIHSISADSADVLGSASFPSLHYTLETTLGVVMAQSVVIATGGLSIPTMGASGFGYQIAKQFGLKVLSQTAGLVPFTLLKESLAVWEPLVGSSLPVTVSCNGQTFKENLLFTHRGLSGPAILQISSYWNQGQFIDINLLPDIELSNWIVAQREQHPNQLLTTALSHFLTKNMAQLFVSLWCENKPLAQYSLKELQQLDEKFHHWQIKPNGTEGYRTAEVTLGGVCTDELSSKTMEAKKQQGLYFIGEVVDVTGHLGGFNFQWAWASGYAAGLYV